MLYSDALSAGGAPNRLDREQASIMDKIEKTDGADNKRQAKFSFDTTSRHYQAFSITVYVSEKPELKKQIGGKHLRRKKRISCW